MDDFKKQIQKLSVDSFKPGELETWEYPEYPYYYDAEVSQRCWRCGGCFRCGGCGRCFGCGGCVGCFACVFPIF
ncbi:heterocycloanthracin/sonorensin family bacteriocin [Thermoactinomyces sp. CICC 10521]|nr:MULTISPECIES: heterocycloanthracin/sonorensin family bacteriocin [unclassified Thermoactinomyces]MBH8597265.1 heterocycloanthracin/sonorensin family bacteriocin [Thermoactinomyces sp. CICC 10523]MBH8602826.1 heterocycloanthracin/sonorensin family bacteriocin [Thermoactinomyces sp. CICC 10522]MBH8606066.1 heterocycloanthracin/sonorensin family bacteriocin [Thermoactinomyces sp. CICC 10521]